MIELKNLYLICGQSGTGKSTLAEKLEQEYNIKQVLSYTTRKPRYEGENTHIFISDRRFDKLKDIVAFTEFDGHRYCATKAQLDDCGTYVIDPEGIDTLRKNYTDKPLKVIYLKAHAGIRYERMKERLLKANPDIGVCSTASLDRIAHDSHAFYFYEHGLAKIDLTVKNEGDIDELVRQVYEFIQATEAETEEKESAETAE